MKVKTITRFHDLEAKCIREVGEQFEVSKERYEVLKNRQYVKVLKELKETAAQ